MPTITREALLIYNPNAGGSAEDLSKQYQQALEKAGFEPVYRATRSEQDLDEILPEARGLVVAVGGDGTLRAVATRLIGKANPLALVPNGTANNVGHALGVVGDPFEVLSGLSNPRRKPMDVGRIQAPWGDCFFLEGGGFGLYAESLARYRPEAGKSVLRGASTLAEVLLESPASCERIRLDGKEEEGPYLLLEAMNTNAVGPRLGLAPHAQVDDGRLEVVRVRESERESYLTYLRALAANETPECKSVRSDSVTKLEFLWNGFPIHHDAEFWQLPEDPNGGLWVTIDVLPAALELWLPEER
ncbi:MAG: NAD(+)/NADH kinase [Candidatus Eremiobacteraeota bacterium]|nr:NAD(+)/NADH kinase [Candidatus Eremiobacteraeota bacterium]